MESPTLSLISPGEFSAKVSSVLNRDTRQYGKKFMFDGHQETCWNSDEGSPQYILIEFPCLVSVSEIRIQFQGGFASKDCSLLCSTDDSASFEELIKFYPEDISSLQCFPVPSSSPSRYYKEIKIVFNSSTDFYGRITVYSLDLCGVKL